MNIAEDLAVVISNYNYGEYLYEAVACLYAQTLVPREILVIDDASTDHSRSVIETIRKDYPRTLIHFNEHNLGGNQTITKALSLLTARYVASLGADDPLYDPGFFAKAMPMLRKHPQVAYAFGEYRTLYELTGDSIFCEMSAGFNVSDPLYIDPGTFLTMFRENPHYAMPTQPAIWLREEWIHCGGLIAELHWHADVFAALVLGSKHGACFFPGRSQTVRISPTSMSRDPVLKRNKTQSVLKTVLNLLNTPQFSHAKLIYKTPPTLGRFGFDALHYLIHHPEHREFLTLDLFRSIIIFEHLQLDLPAFLKQFLGKRVNIETIAQEFLHAASKQMLSDASDSTRRGQLAQAAALKAKALSANHDAAECRESQPAASFAASAS